jgi:hypothetical protein
MVPQAPQAALEPHVSRQGMLSLDLPLSPTLQDQLVAFPVIAQSSRNTVSMQNAEPAT